MNKLLIANYLSGFQANTDFLNSRGALNIHSVNNLRGGILGKIRLVSNQQRHYVKCICKNYDTYANLKGSACRNAIIPLPRPPICLISLLALFACFQPGYGCILSLRSPLCGDMRPTRRTTHCLTAIHFGRAALFPKLLVPLPRRPAEGRAETSLWYTGRL